MCVGGGCGAHSLFGGWVRTSGGDRPGHCVLWPLLGEPLGGAYGSGWRGSPRPFALRHTGRPFRTGKGAQRVFPRSVAIIGHNRSQLRLGSLARGPHSSQPMRAVMGTRRGAAGGGPATWARGATGGAGHVS